MATPVTYPRNQILAELQSTYLLFPYFNLCVPKNTLSGYLLSQVCVWDQSDARFKRLFEQVLQPPTDYIKNTLIEEVPTTAHPQGASYLQESEKLGPVNRSLFKILTGRLNFLERPDHASWLGYVLNFLHQSRPRLMEAVSVAQSWQERLSKIAAKGRNETSQEAFEVLSQEILTKIGEEDSVLIFSSCCTNPKRLLSHAKKLGSNSGLNDALMRALQDESFHPVVADVARVLAKKHASFFKDVPQKYRDIFHELINAGPIESWPQGRIKKVITDLGRLLPMFFHQGVIDSLIDLLRDEKHRELLHSFCDKINASGIESGIQDIYAENSFDFWDQISKIFDGGLNFFQSFLPAEALPLMHYFGIAPISQPLWLEIKKSGASQVDITLLLKAADGSNRCKMTYSGVDKDRITPNFIKRLLMFYLSPKWEEDMSVSYSETLVLESITAFLGQDPELEDLALKSLGKQQLSLNESFVPLLHDQLDATQEYNLRRQALIDFWFSNERDLALLNQEASDLLRFAHEKNLSDLEKGRMRATLDEIQSALKAAKTKEIREETSFLLPPAVQAPLLSLVGNFGLRDEYGQLIKNVMRSVFGDEIGNTVDEYLEELTPSTEAQNELMPWTVRTAVLKLAYFTYSHVIFLSVIATAALMKLFLTNTSLKKSLLVATGAEISVKFLSNHWPLRDLIHSVRDYLIQPFVIRMLQFLFEGRETALFSRIKSALQRYLHRGELELSVTPLNNGHRRAVPLQETNTTIELVGYSTDNIPPLFILNQTFPAAPEPARGISDLLGKLEEIDASPHLTHELITTYFAKNKQPRASIEQLEILSVKLNQASHAIGTTIPALLTNFQISYLIFLANENLYGLEINGWELLYLVHVSKVRIPSGVREGKTLYEDVKLKPFLLSSPALAEQYFNLCEMFDIDPDRSYTDKDIEDLAKNSLFSHRQLTPKDFSDIYTAFWAGWFFYGGINESMEASLFEKLFATEDRRKYVEAFIPGCDKFHRDVFWLFFENPPLTKAFECEIIKKGEMRKNELKQRYLDTLRITELPESYTLNKSQREALANEFRTEMGSEDLGRPQAFIAALIEKDPICVAARDEHARITEKLEGSQEGERLLPADVTTLRRSVLLTRQLLGRYCTGEGNGSMVCDLEMTFKRSEYYGERPLGTNYTGEVTSSFFPLHLPPISATHPRTTEKELLYVENRSNPEFKKKARWIELSDYVLRRLENFNKSYKPEHLRDLFYAGHLQRQLERHPDCARAIAKAIEEALKYHDSKGNIEKCIEIRCIAIQLREYCQSHYDIFPSYELDLLNTKETYRPAAMHALINAYHVMNDACSNQAIKHLIIALFEISRHHLRLDGAENIFVKWKPIIMRALNHNVSFRNEVLNELADRIHVNPPTGSWEGDFPEFTNGLLKLNLLLGGLVSNEGCPVKEIEAWAKIQFGNSLLTAEINKSGQLIIEGQIYQFVQRFTTSDATNRLDQMKPQVNMLLKRECILVENNLGEYSVQDTAITVTVTSETITDDRAFSHTKDQFIIPAPPDAQKLKISRPFDGDTHTLAPRIDLSKTVDALPENALVWLKDDQSQIVITEDERRLATIATHRENDQLVFDGIDFHVNGQNLARIDLGQNKHGLSILTLFHDNVWIYATKTEKNRVILVRYHAFDLEFEREGEHLVNKGIFRGFRIAKTQRDLAFTQFPRYLKLENNAGDVKLLCAESHGMSTIAIETLKKIVPTWISPFLAKELESVAKELLQKRKETFYAFDVKDGELHTEDPRAISYLLYKYACSGDIVRAKRTLSIFASIAAQEPIEENTFHLIEWIQLSLLLNSDKNARLLSLRLCAIVERNARNKKPEQTPLTRYISFVAVQYQYMCYLKNRKPTDVEGLSIDDEFYLLEALAQTAINIAVIPIQNVTIKSLHIGAWILEQLGGEGFVRCNLLIPKIANRYRQIKAELGQPVQEADIISGAKDNIAKALKIIRHLPHPVLRSELNHESWSQFFDQVLSDEMKGFLSNPGDDKAIGHLWSLSLNLFEITPKTIQENFFFYLFLARREYPVQLKGAEGALFTQKCDTFLQILPHIKFYSSPHATFLIHALDIVAKNAQNLAPNLWYHQPKIKDLKTDAINAWMQNLRSYCLECHLKAAFGLAELKSFFALVANLGTSTSTTPTRAVAAPRPSAEPFISLEMQERLTALDCRFYEQLNYLFESHFASQKGDAAPTTPDLEPLLGEDPSFKRIVNAAKSYCPKTGDTYTWTEPEELIQKLRTLEAQYVQDLSRAKQRITSLIESKIHADQPWTDPEIEFEDIVNQLIRGELSNTDLEPVLLFHRIATTHLQHIRRILSKCTCAQTAGEEISRRRCYSLDNTNLLTFRTLIAFEERANTYVWEKPLKFLKSGLNSGAKNTVIELVVGMGKTYFIAPQISQLIGPGRISFTLFPRNVIATNKKTIRNQARDIFSCKAPSFTFSRATPYTVAHLKSFIQTMDESARCKNAIIMIGRDSQSFELSYLLALDENKLELLPYFRDARVLMKTRVTATVDEAHETYKETTELCYAVGGVKSLKDHPDEVQIVAAAASYVFKNPNCTPPSLGKYLLHQFNHEQKFLLYVSGAARPPRGYKNNSQINLIKGLCTQLVPKYQSSSPDVDFGHSDDPSLLISVPYLGNNTPSPRAIDRTPWVGLFRTFMLRLTKGLRPIEALGLLQHLQSCSKESDWKCMPEFTWYQKHFESRFGPLTALENGNKTALLAAFQEKGSVAALYYTEIFADQFRYYERTITSNALDLVYQFDRTIGMTGTATNRGVYVQGTKVKTDDEALGETLQLISRSYPEDRDTPLHRLDRGTPLQILTRAIEIICANEAFTALLDPGPLLDGIHASDIAEKLDESLPAKFLGIAFYDEQSNAWMYERETKKTVPLSQSTLRAHQRFTYLADQQNIAADIPQPENALALILTRKTTHFTKISQSIGRITRGEKRDDKRVQFAFVQNPDIDHVWALVRSWADAENVDRRMSHYISDRDKITSIVRREILTHIDSQKTAKAMREMYIKYRDILAPESVIDPSALYGGVDKRIEKGDIPGVFETLKQQILDKLIDFPRIEEIRRSFEGIGTGEYPEFVTVTGETYVDATGADRCHEIEAEADVQRQAQRETQRESLREQNIYRDTDEAPIISNVSLPSRIGWKEDFDLTQDQWWKTHLIDVSNRPWYNSHPAINETGCAIFSLRDALSLNSELKEAASILPQNAILCTQEFLPVLTNGYIATPIDPLTFRRKPIMKVLVIKHNDEFTFIIDDIEGSDSLRKKIHQKPRCQNTQFCLYDIPTQTIDIAYPQDQSSEKLRKIPQFQHLEVLIHIINGNAAISSDFLGDALIDWQRTQTEHVTFTQIRALAENLRKSQTTSPFEKTPFNTFLTTQEINERRRRTPPR